MKTIFEKSVAGREGCWPCEGMAEEAYIPKELLRDGDIGLPSASELDVVRHFTRLSSATSAWTGISTRSAPAP